MAQEEQCGATCECRRALCYKWENHGGGCICFGCHVGAQEAREYPERPPIVLASGRTLAIEGAVQHVEQYGYLLDATAVEVAMVTAALRQRRM